jgi:hypothetical protein
MRCVRRAMALSGLVYAQRRWVPDPPVDDQRFLDSARLRAHTMNSWTRRQSGAQLPFAGLAGNPAISCFDPFIIDIACQNGPTGVL